MIVIINGKSEDIQGTIHPAVHLNGRKRARVIVPA